MARSFAKQADHVPRLPRALAGHLQGMLTQYIFGERDELLQECQHPELSFVDLRAQEEQYLTDSVRWG